MMKPFVMLFTGLALLGLVACSSTGPILYPNAHFQAVGQNVAEQDVEYCRQMAEAAGAREEGGTAENIATTTAMSAGMGAASGAAGGAISGSAGTGSLIGAASGATWGLLRSIFQTSRPQPNQAYVNFVYRCLQEKGYEVTGWQ
jgi:Glycine-zipper domain